MPSQFSIHYTVAEARRSPPPNPRLAGCLGEMRRRLKILDKRVGAILAEGKDAGGKPVNELIRTLAECRGCPPMQFHRRQIQVKDLKKGLIDFPSLRNGREIFLCWERDEEDIEFWHDLETGYAGREPL